MRRARFDERLDAVIEQALKRLYKRMKWAYFRGELHEYLARIGLATVMKEKIDTGDLRELLTEAGALMTKGIRRARKMGYLKDYLRRINMLDILLGSHHIQTVTLRAVPLPRTTPPRTERRLETEEGFTAPRLTLVK